MFLAGANTAAQRFCHTVGREFASTGKVACQTSLDGIAGTKQALNEFLHYGLAVLDDEKFVALCSQGLYLLVGQRILRHLDEVGIIAYGFLHIVVGDAASQNARL